MARREYKKEIKSKRLFITGSTRNQNTDTILTESYQEMSSSFANKSYLLNGTNTSPVGGLIYIINEMQEDIADIHTEVSESVYVSQISELSNISTGSFGIVSSSLIPDKDDTYSLGTSGREWDNLYVDGTAYIDDTTITTATIQRIGSGFGTFTGTDTTPTVGIGDKWLTSNARPTSITTFDDAVEGQMITIIFGDANTTLVHNVRTMLLSGARNWTPASGDTITLIYNRLWYEVSRSDNT